MPETAVTDGARAPGGRQWRVLAVDDSPEIRLMMGKVLRGADFEYFEATSGQAGLERAGCIHPDVVLLDIHLPDVSGLEVLTQLRASSSVPVIMVTADGTEEDRVRGLDLGADDYIVKPFLAGELVARVRAAIRRSRTHRPPERIVLDGLEIDFGSRMVVAGGRPVELRQKEFELLALLATNPDRTFTRDELLHEVWASRPEWQSAGTVTEHVRRVRVKIEPDPSRPRWVLTVRGGGYRFGT